MTASLYDRIEAIERFAADVAHELKNPLTSLRSAVETLPLARNDESRGRLLEVILHDVRRLDRLISDISDASRLDAEMQRLDGGHVDIAILLETIVEISNSVKNPDKVKVELSLSRRGGLIIPGHDSRIGQVITNLVDNAKSFSPEEGCVRVTAARRGAKLVITVDDDGPGVPEDAFEKIFQRFYTDRPNHGFGNNSGLGLSISKQIVEAHGGTIVPENRTDRHGSIAGARFTVILPAA
ncbi:signal transduction histidine kinase [Bradyrhizobium sp. USDA 4350]